MTEARCKHFGNCGGCKLQDVPYGEQLKGKEERVRGLLGECREIVPCEDPWHYRNKMEFSFSQDKAGRRFLGLMRKRGRVVDLEECHLVSEWFMEALEEVRKWWAQSGLRAFHPYKGEGVLRTLTLRESRGGDRLAMLTVAEPIEWDVELGGASLVVRHQIAKKGEPTRFEMKVMRGKGYFEETLCGMHFKVSPTAFFQPNTVQAEVLYEMAMEMVDGGVVWDLYCGTGTIGILAGKRAKKVIGVEINEEAVRDAKENARMNGLKHVEFIAGDVGEVVERLEDKPDVIFVDPPRAGLGKGAVELIAGVGCKRIIYISCNPVTQSEDIKGFTGYEVVDVRPIDQFPHTPHVENVVYLESRAK